MRILSVKPSFLLPFLLALAAGGMAAWLPIPVVAGVMGVTAVFLLAIIEPLIGLGIALLLAPLAAVEGNLLAGLPLGSGQLLLLLTLAVCLGRSLSRRRLFIPVLPINAPLFIFLWITAVSLTFAGSFPLAFKEWAKWVEIGLIIWMISTEEEGRGQHHLFILAMLMAAGVTQAILGIWQFGFQPDGPEHFLVLGRFYRAYGTFQQPNPFGGYMNMSALLAMGASIGLIGTVWQERRGMDWRSKKLLWLLALLVVTAVTTAGLLVSWSRGAWLGFVGGTAVLTLFLPRKRWHGILLMGVMAGVLLAAITVGQQLHIAAADSIITRVSSFTQDLTFGDMRGVEVTDSNYAVVERLAHWQAALGMARDHLWRGVGFGNYEAVYAEYALINWPAALGHAHNYYLTLLAEIGVIGLTAYLGFWTAVFIQTIRAVNQSDGLWRGVALGLLAVWTAVAIHHLVDKLYVNNIYIHLGVMLGLLQWVVKGKREIGYGLR